MCIDYFSRIHVAIKLNVGQRKTKTRGGGGGQAYTQMVKFIQM